MIDNIAHTYFDIKNYLLQSGFSEEIDWQNEISIDKIDDSRFLREVAWVILSSGMSEKVISKKFKDISTSFYDWKDFDLIIKNKNECRRKSLKYFNNRLKINAIIYATIYIKKIGFKKIRTQIESNGIDYLQQFPFIGPVTSYHLAKNIGLNVAKSDRHLIKISKKLGFSSPQKFCSMISNRINEKSSVIDIVFWRFATIQKDYLSILDKMVLNPGHEYFPSA